MNREKLIKQAAEAIIEADNAYEWDGESDSNMSAEQWSQALARAAFAVFAQHPLLATIDLDTSVSFEVEGANKFGLPPVSEFVLIEGGKETDWVDPVVEFEEHPDGYCVWNGYANYWFAKEPGTTYVIRMKEYGSES